MIPTLRVRVLQLKQLMSLDKAPSKQNQVKPQRKSKRKNQVPNQTATAMNRLTLKKNKRRKRKPPVRQNLRLNNLLKPLNKSSQLLRQFFSLLLNNQRHKIPYSTFSVVSQAVYPNSNQFRTHLFPKLMLSAYPPSNKLMLLDCKRNRQFKMRLDYLPLKIHLDFLWLVARQHLKTALALVLSNHNHRHSSKTYLDCPLLLSLTQ